MRSYSTTLLGALTIACCIAAPSQAGAQRAESVAVTAPPSDSALMAGPLDPCVVNSAACADPPGDDRCRFGSYRAATRLAAAGTFIGSQAVLWRYFENAWW